MVRSFIRKKQDLQKDEYVCITNNLIFLLQKVHIVLNSCKKHYELSKILNEKISVEPDNYQR